MSAYAGTYHPRLGKMFNTTPPVVWHCPIEASQGLYTGCFVVRTLGYVVEYASAGAMCLGILKENTPSAAGEVEVLIATGMTGILVPVHDSTDDNADIEIGNFGNATYDLNFVASPHWYVDKDMSGSTITIQQFKDALGVLHGLVLITINAGVREVD